MILGGKRLNTLIFALTIYCYFILFNDIMAGDRSNARGLAMSNASVVSSYGIDAYGVNPANYDYHFTYKPLPGPHNLKKKQPNLYAPRSEFSLMSLGGGYGSDSSIDFYNNYLKYLSINRETFTGIFTDIVSVLDFRQRILPNEKTDVNYDFELKWLSANYSNPKYGAINFTISDKVGLNTNVLSRDEYLPLTFQYIQHSTKYDITNVELHQSEAIAWWIRKYTLGIAKQFDLKGTIKSVSVGMSAGLVQGFGNVITLNSSLYVDTYGISSSSPSHVDSIKGKQNFYTKAALTDFFRDYGDGAESHFTFFPKPAGTGYSFDLGFAVQLGDMFRVAASITEIGKIKWDYNTFVNNDTNSFIYRNFNLSSSDPTYNQLVNDLEGLDTRDTLSPYETYMPTKYRAGIMFRPNNKLLIEFDWVKGDNNLPGNTTANIISLGGEYSVLSFLPLRAGVSAGGPEEWTVSFGAGLKLKYVVLDFAAYGINNMISNKRLSFAFSGKLTI